MAKYSNNSIATMNLSGKVGNIRFCIRNGKTFMRTAGCNQQNPRTERQQKIRVRFASISALWNVLKQHLEGMYLKESPNVHDFNMFTKLNQGMGVFVKKEEKSTQLIALPVQISQGPLCSIGYEMNEKRLVSNLMLGDLVIDETTTIGELSQQLFSLNTQMQIDISDELLFFACRQLTAPSQEGETHSVTIATTSFTINPLDRRLVCQVIEPQYFRNCNGYLATDELPDGCYGYLFRRKLNQNEFLFSSQRLANNNEALIAAFTSDEKFNEVAPSYGKMSKSVFADPRE